MTAFDLSGKTILVTGAGRGLGRSIAEGLHAAGAHIIAVARTQSDLDALAADLGDRIECWTEDVQTASFIQRIGSLDKLDGLVNNAGTNRPKPMEEVTDDDLDVLVDLNLKALYRTAQAAVRLMQRQGHGVVVNMSSQMGHVGAPTRTVYCMTKHGVEGLTKAMAVELAPKGIRVNSIAPTFVETPMTKPFFEDPAFADYVQRMIPMGKLAQPEDIAAGVVYLMSDEARMLTGQSLVIDGGWTAH